MIISLILLAILINTVSCVPITITHKISYLPDISHEFPDKSERILILPEFIIIHSYNKRIIYRTFGKPLFTPAKELSNLHDKIPNIQQYTGISFPSIGTFTYIDSFVIISETGKTITICCLFDKDNYKKCNSHYADCINKKLKDDLIDIFTRSNNEIFSTEFRVRFDNANMAIAELTSNQCRKGKGSDYKITNSDIEKEEIVNFISGIKYLCKGNYKVPIEVDPFGGYNDRAMDKTEGESCRDSVDCAKGYFCINQKCKKSSIFKAD